MLEMVEQYERCYYLGAYTGQECELCPRREACERRPKMHNNSGKYQKLKESGLCVYCGARPPMEGYVLCEKCYNRDKEYRANTFKSPYKKVEKKENIVYDLDTISKMAYARGISYGQMVAILEGHMKDVPLLTDTQ